MPVMSLVVELQLAEPLTTRQKKQRADEILTKLRHHFNVAVGDVSRPPPEEPLALGFSAVGRTRREAREILEHVAAAVASYPRITILRVGYDEL